ncbi:FHIPEP family type III secretion protein [Brucella anthropi]|uniref:FHIPEP family type III secretion protein n=1 Tax=Brucella anthropi TaxID=529 RepID=UPI003850FCAF
MIILRVPAYVLDVLIALNFSASILILLTSLQVHSPVQFSTFPSLLLVTTLFRLAISISTTRLILLERDAGKIVETFGAVVIGGNLIVGLVIFMIITVVQFLVITKGADRVAEVGARFALDGMPGKQMSIDADVRAGTIEQLDASSARRDLEREAKLFGAMDGAMKFVKGDAIAGLFITFINLAGGIAIGLVQHDLAFTSALELYALLTVGDGLISQIPALLISIAAGNLVTRVGHAEGIDLSTEILQQITVSRRAVFLASGFICLFGLIPGFPTVIFAVIGAGISIAALWSSNRQLHATRLAERDWYARLSQMNMRWSDIERRTGTNEALKLILPKSVYAEDVNLFVESLNTIQNVVEKEYGIRTGFWRFEFGNSHNQYKVMVKQEYVEEGTFYHDAVFVKAHSSYLEALNISCLAVFDTKQGVFVSRAFCSRLDSLNILYWTPLELLMMHLKGIIIERADTFGDIQSVANALTALQNNNRALVDDLRAGLSNFQISGVLRMLLQERIPISSEARIFHTILVWSHKKPDPEFILQKVRNELSDQITKRFAPDGFLQVILVSPSLENCIRQGMKSTPEGTFLVIEPSISASIGKRVQVIVNEGFKRGRDPVVLVQQDIRRTLYVILREQGIYIPVLAYQEISPHTVVYPVDYISIDLEA